MSWVTGACGKAVLGASRGIVEIAGIWGENILG